MKLASVAMAGLLAFGLLGVPQTRADDKATALGVGIAIGVAATLLSEEARTVKTNKTVKSSTKKLSPTQSAKANCRELGGYWTGSYCKASKNAKKGKCKDGYVWSSEAGACQYDGGATVVLVKKKKVQKPWERPGCKGLQQRCDGGQGEMAACESYQNLCSND